MRADKIKVLFDNVDLAGVSTDDGEGFLVQYENQNLRCRWRSCR